ncbi:hypothetical protein C8Q75DRAFT_885922, partial [Abortiporus biennis]
MSRGNNYNYNLRENAQAQERISTLLDDLDEYDASSSVVWPSSSPPVTNDWDIPSDTPFASIDSELLPEDDPDDASFGIPLRPSRRAPRYSKEEKAQQVIDFMAGINKFSLRDFLETLFTSENEKLKHSAMIFFSSEGLLQLMDIWWDISSHMQRREHPGLAKWVIEHAASLCKQEFSFLTDQASTGPHKDDATFLRMPAEKVSKEFVEQFQLSNLTTIYDRTTPYFQTIIHAVIGNKPPGCRNPAHACTTITSIALNMRSRITNYHAAVLSVIMWDQQVPKRLVQMFNHIGLSTSYQYQCLAIDSLGRDMVCHVRLAAADRKKLTMLGYDNFNWCTHAWEVSVSYRDIQHDQVSAILFVLSLPTHRASIPAEQLASVHRFIATLGRRHTLKLEDALRGIIPSREDHINFRQASLIHVYFILSQHLPVFTCFSSSILVLADPHAITPHKTELYYLPTFDQEQASMKGNIVVLTHYFLTILQLPKDVFENIMFFILGDWLTTARDRATQDQRSVDHLPYRVDHLSSFAMTSGLMHHCLTMIQNIGQNFWGSDGSTDAVSLSKLRDLLPNRTNVNLRKIDFYAWLQFLDVVLCSLVIAAATVSFDTPYFTQISAAESIQSAEEAFRNFCGHIVDSFLVPSIDSLEVQNIKTIIGDTQTGHAILLMHNLMMLREMRYAIKHGHP